MVKLASAIVASVSMLLSAPALANPGMGWTPSSFSDGEAVTVAYQLNSRKEISSATARLEIKDETGNLLHEDSVIKTFSSGAVTEVRFKPFAARTPGTKLFLRSGLVSSEQVWSNEVKKTITKQCKQPVRGSASSKGADGRVECRWSAFKKGT